MEHQQRLPTSKDISTRLKSVQDLGWMLLLILIPLGVNLWGQRPFELPKVLLMRTMVWLLAGLMLIEHRFNPRSLRLQFKANPMLGAVGLLAIVIVVTTVTAVNWRLSLWGSIERNQGSLTGLTYLLLFLLAAAQLHSASRARQIVSAMVVTTAPLILFGLAQSMGWNPFGLISDARSPIYATLGRANFLGAYLAITAPLTLALLLTTRQQKMRLLGSFLFMGQLVIIGLTLTRSAWLATAVSLSLFALLWCGSRLAQRWQKVAWAGFAMLFLSGPLLIFGLGQRQLGSTAARISIWQGTCETAVSRVRCRFFRHDVPTSLSTRARLLSGAGFFCRSRP